MRSTEITRFIERAARDTSLEADGVFARVDRAALLRETERQPDGTSSLSGVAGRSQGSLSRKRRISPRGPSSTSRCTRRARAAAHHLAMSLHLQRTGGGSRAPFEEEPILTAADRDRA